MTDEENGSDEASEEPETPTPPTSEDPTQFEPKEP